MTPNFKIIDSDDRVIDYEVFKFPSGEIQVNLRHRHSSMCITIIGNVLSSDHLMELLQLSSLLKLHGRRVYLDMPYCAYSRQDRHMTSDKVDCFSLKVFTQLIKW